ncbi:zinc finger BED domain-containing 1-like [Brachionus plicatilis]|uniref:Zinc finger BED domain-containing 1-like n=1 Tax=Brachionus plicatilis TaxID=10195 RepID=A0A3M7R6P5_BRAPC|nr:zinc finger BED domain-containing 1-like [Brachionus plicatilis]
MTQQTESYDGSMQLESIEQTVNDLTQGENFVSSPLKRRRNESPIWTYCVRLDNGQKKCNVDFCSKFFEKTTSNSAIMDHLKDVHFINCRPQRSDIVQNLARNASTKHCNEEQTKGNKALLKTFQPFTIVNSQSFLEFCYILDSRYVIPERHSVSTLVQKEYENTLNILKVHLKLLESKVILINFTVHFRDDISVMFDLRGFKLALSILRDLKEEKPNNDILLDNDDFEKAIIVLDLLEPFNQIANVLQTHTTGTLDLSGDSYNSCSQLYLIFIELMAHLDTKLKEKKYSSPKLTIESMKLKIEDY